MFRSGAKMKEKSGSTDTSDKNEILIEAQRSLQYTSVTTPQKISEIDYEDLSNTYWPFILTMFQ
jgi:hypothetical protein